MTIEAKPAMAPQPSGGAHAAGKATIGPATAATRGQGFASLVSTLSTQVQIDAVASDGVQSGFAFSDEEEIKALAAENQSQSATVFMADLVLQSAGLSDSAVGQDSPDSDVLQLGVLAGLTTRSSASEPAPTTADKSAPALASTSTSGAAVQPEAASVQTSATSPTPELAAEDPSSRPLPPAKVPDGKPILASANAQIAQAAVVLPEPSKALTAVLSAVELARPVPDGGKHRRLVGQTVVDGLAPVQGWVDRGGVSATYAIVEASAVVPDTRVAETVSYWVTHGVQKAELTLDGLGSEPVEVHISVDGDQTRVDFRTNQIEVRQAIEGAAGQLKNLLTSEGLQLLGLSVGASDKGHTAGDGRQRRPELARRGNVVGVQAITVAPGRVANTAVGQALDLYV